MAQTKPKAAQFYGVSGNGTAGQVLISDGNGGMAWGSNTEQFTISWNTPTGQGLTYTQPSPQSSVGTAGSAFPSTTFTVTKSDSILSGTATIAGLPTGIAASQSYNNTSIGNILTVTLTGTFPGADSLNTDLTLSGLLITKTVSWATPTGQSLTYTQPSPQSSTENPGTAFPTTTFTATKSGEIISGTATITGLPTGITATQSLSGSGIDNILTVTLAGVFPNVDSLNTNLTISGLTVATPLTISYLIVAGGGGGGSYYAGGGGAGGMLSGNLTTASLSFSATVGGGGGWNSNGSNSIFNSITAIGGGKGGDATSGGYTWGIGGTGGSGGGSSGKRGGGSNTTGGQGTAGQGNNGGYGVSSGFGDTGGAGGGAGAAGTSPTSAVRYTVGGIGVQSSITGSAVYYAGGGGGNGSYAGTGGAGGGATAVNNGPSPNATPNTGGGGAGGNMWPSTSYTPSNGGSGIVIIRYPNGYTASVGGLGYGVLNATVSGSTDKYTTLTSGTGTISIN